MSWQTVVSVFSALLTPVIAIIATYIAWQQWKGNELKLRLERYEKRLRIYQEVIKMLSLIMRDADAKLEDLMTFRANTAEADFLFGPEIPEYIVEIFSRGLKLRRANIRYQHAGQEEPAWGSTERSAGWASSTTDPSSRTPSTTTTTSGSWAGFASPSYITSWRSTSGCESRGLRATRSSTQHGTKVCSHPR